jgi:phosphoribosylformylglycinamidine synthase
MSARSATGLEVSGEGLSTYAELFSEVPGRVVACTGLPGDLIDLAIACGVPARVIGRAGGSRIVVEGMVDLPVAEVVDCWVQSLPAALGEPLPEAGSRR